MPSLDTALLTTVLVFFSTPAPKTLNPEPLSDGLTRVEEHRRMVAALHRKGLRVVADVVFNHVPRACRIP